MAKYVCDGLTPTSIWPAVNLSNVKHISKIFLLANSGDLALPSFLQPLHRCNVLLVRTFVGRAINWYRVEYECGDTACFWTLLQFHYSWNIDERKDKPDKASRPIKTQDEGTEALPPTSYAQILQVRSIIAGTGSQPSPSHTLGGLLYLLGWTGLTQSGNYIKITHNFKKYANTTYWAVHFQWLNQCKTGHALAQRSEIPTLPGLQTWVCKISKPE